MRALPTCAGTPRCLLHNYDTISLSAAQHTVPYNGESRIIQRNYSYIAGWLAIGWLASSRQSVCLVYSCLWMNFIMALRRHASFAPQVKAQETTTWADEYYKCHGCCCCCCCSAPLFSSQIAAREVGPFFLYRCTSWWNVNVCAVLCWNCGKRIDCVSFVSWKGLKLHQYRPAAG